MINYCDDKHEGDNGHNERKDGDNNGGGGSVLDDNESIG